LEHIYENLLLFIGKSPSVWDCDDQKEIRDIQILGVQLIIEYQGMWFAHLKGNLWYSDLINKVYNHKPLVLLNIFAIPL